MVAEYKTEMTQTEYRAWFSDERRKRQKELDKFVRKAFANQISDKEEPVIDLSTDELG